MIWNKVAKIYDFFEEVVNKKVYEETGEYVAREKEDNDVVLECACGTGTISKYIAKKCKHLTATDYAEKMLIETKKILKDFNNVIIEKADITKLNYDDESFDKVVAGNVIHLLDNPYDVLNELLRVCKKNGKVIIPTYTNMSGDKQSLITKILDKFGIGFKRQFSLETYKEFFLKAGHKDVIYDVVEGRMPCGIAIIKK